MSPYSCRPCENGYPLPSSPYHCPRLAQREGDGEGWFRQLGDLGQMPTLEECLAQGMVLDMATGQCVPAWPPPGYVPPGGQPPPGEPPPGGVEDPGCTWWQALKGECVPAPGTIPGGGQPPPGQPPPPQLPGMVTEQQCAARAQLAFNKGKSEEAARVVKTAVVTATVSAVVGFGLGYLLLK